MPSLKQSSAALILVSFFYMGPTYAAGDSCAPNGVASNKATGSPEKIENRIGKVTGIGGVFFRSTGDHKALGDWYEKNLGIHREPWGGAILKWSADKKVDGGVTVWDPFEKDSSKFGPGKPAFIINYRVDNLEALHNRLKKNGVVIVEGPTSDEQGKFLSIMDPDGNRVELWEPIKKSVPGKKK